MAPHASAVPVEPTQGNVHIEAADTKNKWKTLSRMKRYCFWVLFLTLGTVMQGYDFSIFGNLLAFQTFDKRFGHFDKSTDSYIVSANVQAQWNAASSSCQVLGGLVSGYYSPVDLLLRP